MNAHLQITASAKPLNAETGSRLPETGRVLPQIAASIQAAATPRILSRHTCGNCRGHNTLGCSTCDGEGGWLVCTFCGEDDDVECSCDAAEYALADVTLIDLGGGRSELRA